MTVTEFTTHVKYYVKQHIISSMLLIKYHRQRSPLEKKKVLFKAVDVLVRPKPFFSPYPNDSLSLLHAMGLFNGVC